MPESYRPRTGDIVTLNTIDYDGRFTVIEPSVIYRHPNSEENRLGCIIEPINLEEFMDKFIAKHKHEELIQDGVVSFTITTAFNEIELYQPAIPTSTIKN